MYVCISSYTTINDIKGAEITIMLLKWSSQKVFSVSFHVWLFFGENICFKFHRTYLSSCPKQKYLPFLVPVWPPLDMMGWWKVDRRGYQKIWIDWQIWLIISGWRNRSEKNQWQDCKFYIQEKTVRTKHRNNCEFCPWFQIIEGELYS